MLSKTIRNAAISGKYNEFDLETWAHEARKLESALDDIVYGEVQKTIGGKKMRYSHVSVRTLRELAKSALRD